MVQPSGIDFSGAHASTVYLLSVDSRKSRLPVESVSAGQGSSLSNPGANVDTSTYFYSDSHADQYRYANRHTASYLDAGGHGDTAPDARSQSHGDTARFF